MISTAVGGGGGDKNTPPYHALPQMRVKPVKMFMQMSLIKQDIHVANNKDAIKRNMGS